MLRITISLFFLAIGVGLGAEQPSPEQIIERYMSATRLEHCNPQDELMQVSIDATLPALHKQGKLRTWQFISRLGGSNYKPLGFEGDQMVEKNVIARYLTTEQQARATGTGSMDVTPANYNFKFLRAADYNGLTAYVFELEPKQKRTGLFLGELWLDARTFLPLREWGQLLKTPSIFVKNVYFVRDYLILGGRSVPRRTIAKVDTRLAGAAELTIWFDPIAFGDKASEALRCVNLGGKPQLLDTTLLGMSNVLHGDQTVGSNACTL